MQQAGQVVTGFRGVAGEIVSGAVLSGLVAIAAGLAWAAWPASPAVPHEQAAVGRAPVATPVTSPLRTVIVEFVVESEEQAESLRERGVIPSSAAYTALPIRVEVVDAQLPADREARDDHLRTVCAVTECTKVLYVDLRRIQLP